MNKMRPDKYITTLQAPGALSDNTMDILKHYYPENLGSTMVLGDGLTIKRDEEDIDTFYILCPSTIDKVTAIGITDYAKDILIKNGIDNPKVIFLPDGIRPRSI